MESLEFWLEKIAKNSDGKFTHWEIEVLFTEMTKLLIPPPLEVQILPLLVAIRERGKSHKHKANIAVFTLDLIKNFKSTEDKKFDPDSF
jgi:hypothetical protein